MESSVRAELIAQGKQLKERLSQLEAHLIAVEARLQQEAQKIPNLTHPQVCARHYRKLRTYECMCYSCITAEPMC